MKKPIAILIILLISALFLTACGDDDEQNALKKRTAERVGEVAEDKAEDAKDKAKLEKSQKLINFECDIANIQQIYFLKGDMKMVTPNTEAWLIDDKYYVKMNSGGRSYLVTYPGEESEMDAKDMMTTYTTSKTLDNIDCKLGTVSESMMTLPSDLEVIDEDEFQDRIEQDLMDSLPQYDME